LSNLSISGAFLSEYLHFNEIKLINL
jgi:hypothetical protein